MTSTSDTQAPATDDKPIPSQDPIWRMYRLTQLVEKVHYAYGYLYQIKEGKRTTNERFMNYCSTILKQPQKKLFAWTLAQKERENA